MDIYFYITTLNVYNIFLKFLLALCLIKFSGAKGDSYSIEFRQYTFSFYLYHIRLQLRTLWNFVSLFGDVETRRLVSRISSSHVTWLAGDITIPFILPLMPTVTHTFPQPWHFPENRGRRFTKLFLRVHTHTHTTNTVTLKFLDSRRVSRSSRVVNTNCRSIIGFFGRVVGSRRLPRRTTYPRVAALADIWHASTADTRKPLCMPTTRHLYTSRHYRRSLSAQRGSRSRYFEIQPPAREPCAVLARVFAWRESLFLRRFISTSLSEHPSWKIYLADDFT